MKTDTVMWNKFYKKKNNKIKILTAGFLAVCFLSGGSQTALAAGERVYFGSESYEWWMEEDHFMLGVYAASDDEVREVDLILSYDPDMMEMVQGGQVMEDGRIRVHAEDVDAAEFKRLLSFTPLQAGETEVTIEDAVITNSSGEQVTVSDATTPVMIDIPADCQLDGITVNGTAISDFDGSRANYEIELEENTDKVDISAEPSDADVEISDTALQAGENIVTVTVTGTSGAQARYLLTIQNPEIPVTEETTAPVETPDEEQLTEPGQNVQTGSSFLERGKVLVRQCLDHAKDMIQNHRSTTILMAVIVSILLIVLILILLSNYRRKKREKERKRRREARQRALERQFQEKRDHYDGSPEIPQKTDLTETDKAEQALPEIRVSHVTMDFRREKDESTSVKELVIRTIKRQRSFEYFRALDDVSFEVMPGEVVGIIGTNGSGKSTILKIISGVLSPTKGKVEVDRHKIQLLTLGTGFDYELTGRENVYLNGALIGYTKEYIDEKYEDIVAFAELEGFMEEKVRNYSSGMVSRLGFAIATARDTPEILILDEVLSVGDMFFRQKSEARIQEMIHGGSTVLIVSHSTGVIRKNCTKVVWIEKGHLRMVGDPNEVCTAYEKMNG